MGISSVGKSHQGVEVWTVGQVWQPYLSESKFDGVRLA